MAGFQTTTNERLIRSQMWSSTLKSLLLDELFATKYVRQLDVPADAGSSTFNIPSIGEAQIDTFVEGSRIRYNKFDEGNYQFTFGVYVYSGNSVSEKYMRDSFYANEVVAGFLPRQHRAIMVDYEKRVLAAMNSGQTSANLNAINGANHRWVTGGTNQTIQIKDFALAQYSLKKANVPLTGLVAIVDPSVIYTLQTQTNITNFLSPMPRAESIVSNVTPTGMKFEMNLFGFDIYSSNYLPSGITETVNSVAVTTNGVANYFFATGSQDLLTTVGAWRQHPTVYSDFNKDTQEHEYATICEYGIQGDYRPENLVTILTDASQVS